MNCLCCNKPLKSENENGWHKSCVKKFFGTNEIPEIEISEKMLEELANQTINKGLTVPGVQKKLSLHLISNENKPRLTLVNYPTGYILKPQVKEFKNMPQAEQLVMAMADKAGINTVPHALIKTNDGYAYITGRVDRIFDKTGMKMLAMEDFCQLDFRITRDKYRGSYERCGKIIGKYSARPGLDMAELFIRLVFCFITGNSDMHLKNFSLIETGQGSGEYVLSPAYDLLPVNVIMPEDTEEFALTMNGKKRNIRKKDFMIFADSCNIDKHAAERMIKSVVSKKDAFVKMVSESLLDEDMKTAFTELIEKRVKIFE